MRAMLEAFSTVQQLRDWSAVAMLSLLALLQSEAASAQSRHAAMVLDANSGAILYAQSADEPRYPASLTKMMTLYVVFDLIEQGRLSYSTRIKMSQEAASTAPTKLDLEPGEVFQLIDGIKALITKSANDVAVAIGEHIAGSESKFAQLMTARARQIGMTSTTFYNASGLPAEGQRTTARDMVTLALRLQDDFPRHYKLFATHSFTYHGNSYRNHNNLLFNYQGTDGIKTGYTRVSGFNLVASVRRDGKHLVGAVFGGESAGSRDAQMRSLLSRAFAKASTEKTRKPALVASLKVPAPVAVSRERQPRKLAAASEQLVATAAPVARPALRVVPIEPAKPEQAQPQPVMAPPPAASNNVQIAQVRRVMVAPRPKPEPTPELSTDMPPPAKPTAPAPTTPQFMTTDTARNETVVAKTSQPAIRVATTQPSQPAFAQPPPPVPATVASVTSAPAASSGPGAPPSSLQRQAENLSRGIPPTPQAATKPAPQPRQQVAQASAAAPTWRLKGPEASGPAMAKPAAVPQQTSGRFHIQVGAYATTAEAERQLSAVRDKAADLLGRYQPLTLPVQKEGRQLVRARFAGFDANAAAAACLELRRLSVDCYVNKAE